MSDKTYSELNRVYEYDEAKATIMAEAMTEMVEIEKRKQYLIGLLDQNKGLRRFLWQDETGKVTAFHDLDPDHLVNILNYLSEQGQPISKPMEAEARKRNIALPGTPRLLPAGGSDLVW